MLGSQCEDQVESDQPCSPLSINIIFIIGIIIIIGIIFIIGCHPSYHHYLHFHYAFISNCNGNILIGDNNLGNSDQNFINIAVAQSKAHMTAIQSLSSLSMSHQISTYLGVIFPKCKLLHFCHLQIPRRPPLSMQEVVAPSTVAS